MFSEGTLAPTPYADALYDFARKVTEGYTDLQIDFNAIDASQEHVIRLGFSLGMLDLIGTDTLEQFKKLHPQVDLFFEEVVDERCDENLASGLYDLAFTVAPLPPRVEGVALFSVPMTLWVNSEDALAQARVLRVEDLEGRRIATPAPGAKNVDRLVARWQERGFAKSGIIHLLQMHKIYDFVREGKGVGTHIVGIIESPLFDTEDVVDVPLEDFAFSLYLSWAADHELSAEEQAFVNYIQNLPLVAQIRKAALALSEDGLEKGASG